MVIIVSRTKMESNLLTPRDLNLITENLENLDMFWTTETPKPMAWENDKLKNRYQKLPAWNDEYRKTWKLIYLLTFLADEIPENAIETFKDVMNQKLQNTIERTEVKLNYHKTLRDLLDQNLEKTNRVDITNRICNLSLSLFKYSDALFWSNLTGGLLRHLGKFEFTIGTYNKLRYDYNLDEILYGSEFKNVIHTDDETPGLRNNDNEYLIRLCFELMDIKIFPNNKLLQLRETLRETLRTNATSAQNIGNNPEIYLKF